MLNMIFKAKNKRAEVNQVDESKTDKEEENREQKTNPTNEKISLSFKHDLPVVVSCIGLTEWGAVEKDLEARAANKADWIKKSIQHLGKTDIDLAEELLNLSDGLVKHRSLEKGIEEQLNKVRSYISKNVKHRCYNTDNVSLSADLSLFGMDHSIKWQMGNGEPHILVIRDLEKLSIDQTYTLSINLPLKTFNICLLYTSPSPRDATLSRMPSSA